MDGETRYARCTVLLGLFDSEFYVMVGSSSAYVDRENVKVERDPSQDIEVAGEVLAYVVDEDRENVLVELPREPVVGGIRTWVPKSSLLAAA